MILHGILQIRSTQYFANSFHTVICKLFPHSNLQTHSTQYFAEYFAKRFIQHSSR